MEVVWKHAFISKSRKVQIYQTCIIPKLLYSLESIWLLQNERNKLDAFHHKCLRKCMGIPMSYISRIRNVDVLGQAKSELLSTLLARVQTTTYSRIMQSPEDSLIKKLVCDGMGTPINWENNRRKGRPRQRWAASVHSMGLLVR